MNPKDKMYSPEKWVAHAISDLNLARLGKEGLGVLPEQICFHAQQSVEKALKAILLFSKIDFPLTHDIEELLDLLSEANILLPQEIMDADGLTPYAVETRYPGLYEEIANDDVDKAMSIAEKVVAWAEGYLDRR